MELATLARPYAEAVFELAVESNSLSQWADTLSFLNAVVTDSKFSALVRNPSVDKNALCEILLELCKEQAELNFNEEAENFVKLLINNDRLSVMPSLIKQFEKLKAEHEGYLKVEVISTYAVKTPQKKELTEALEKRFGKKVELEVNIDRSLMGGWLIRTGDQVIDLSVLGRFQHLASDLRG